MSHHPLFERLAQEVGLTVAHVEHENEPGSCYSAVVDVESETILAVLRPEPESPINVVLTGDTVLPEFPNVTLGPTTKDQLRKVLVAIRDRDSDTLNDYVLWRLTDKGRAMVEEMGGHDGEEAES